MSLALFNTAGNMASMSGEDTVDPQALTRSSLHIVGNGPGDMPRPNPHVPLVRFNLPSALRPGAMEILVSNHRHRGYRESAGRPFIVESAWPRDIGGRQALPCAYHNWLGERRLALGLLRGNTATQLSWALLRLPLPVEEPRRHGENASTSPLTELAELLQACRPGAEERLALELARLAGAGMQAWLNGAQPAALRALEPLLFLDRRSRATSNWWLYSSLCAPALDAVLGRLMLCQQLLDDPGPGVPAAS